MILRILARTAGLLFLVVAFGAGFVTYKLAFTGIGLAGEVVLGALVFGVVTLVSLVLAALFLRLARRRPA